MGFTAFEKNPNRRPKSPTKSVQRGQSPAHSPYRRDRSKSKLRSGSVNRRKDNRCTSKDRQMMAYEYSKMNPRSTYKKQGGGDREPSSPSYYYDARGRANRRRSSPMPFEPTAPAPGRNRPEWTSRYGYKSPEETLACFVKEYGDGTGERGASRSRRGGEQEESASSMTRRRPFFSGADIEVIFFIYKNILLLKVH